MRHRYSDIFVTRSCGVKYVTDLLQRKLLTSKSGFEVRKQLESTFNESALDICGLLFPIAIDERDRTFNSSVVGLTDHMLCPADMTWFRNEDVFEGMLH